jgi:hypothetical protein
VTYARIFFGQIRTESVDNADGWTPLYAVDIFVNVIKISVGLHQNAKVCCFPLQALAELKRRYQFLLVVDDAHGSLVLGPHGGGAAEAAGVCDSVDVHTGTLSKAFGSIGGFVACSHAVKAFLVNAARAFTYSTALPVPCVAASLAALDVASRCAKKAIRVVHGGKI